MKKTILFALVILLAATSVFAIDGYVGVKSGYTMDISFPEKLDPVTTNNVPVKADLTLDISDNFAIGTGIGTNIVVPNHGDPTAQFALDVLAYYKMPLDRKLNLYIGGGAGYRLWHDSTGDNNYGDSTTTHHVDVDISSKLVYDVAKSLGIFAGADLGFKVYDGVSMKTTIMGNSSTTTTSSDTFGMSWGITVGAAYKF